jgi:hypothetical protein
MPYNFPMGRSFYLVAALAAAGCGKVAAITATDAAVDAIPDAFSCSATQNACASGCSDPMTDSMNCGVCGNACQATGETCISGHCVDPNISCASLNAAGKPSGLYTLDDSSMVFCNMNDHMTYQELDLGQFNMAYAGYDRITMAEFADPTLQQAFIALYNLQAGAKTMAGFTTSGNCCIKADDTVNMLVFGTGNYMTPATAPSTIVCSTYVPGTAYTVALMESSAMIQATLATTFFTTNPPSTAAFCSTSTNPAFFWKRHP